MYLIAEICTDGGHFERVPEVPGAATVGEGWCGLFSKVRQESMLETAARSL
jgi:hypothetical protein